MYVDSHCHIHFPELLPNLDAILIAMRDNKVSGALSVCVDMESFDKLFNLAARIPNVYASVGVHPNHFDGVEPTEEDLQKKSTGAKVIAIGETGLDYYRLTGDAKPQQERFRRHIRAAVAAQKPLIVHTRQAASDTLKIMTEERARDAGGVMHCFTEDWDVAMQAMDQGFLISLSGIVSFKNAHVVREVARKIPIDKLLIETDSPYLAPIPFRGKTNQPAYVKNVADAIASLRGVSSEDIAHATSVNFGRLFKVDVPALS